MVPACAACHSPTGAGIPDPYPRVAVQHADYTEQQLVAFRSGTRANSEPMTTIARRLSDDEIKAFLSSRYGEFVLYRPPMTPTTFAVWAAPFVLLVLGGFVFWRILAARTKQPLDEEPPP